MDLSFLILINAYTNSASICYTLRVEIINLTGSLDLRNYSENQLMDLAVLLFLTTPARSVFFIFLIIATCTVLTDFQLQVYKSGRRLMGTQLWS